MEFALLYSIPEFDFEISLDKMNLNNKEYYTYEETKKYLYFITGYTIRKKTLKEKVSPQIFDDRITKSNLYSLYQIYVKQINYHDLILSFYNYLKSNSISVTLAQFLTQMKAIYPNINNNLLSQIFLYIDKGNSGELKLTDLESTLLNQS